MAAFDGVRREGERRAREADERDAAVERLLNLLDRDEHVRERLARLERVDARDVGFGLDRVFDRRPFALDEVEADAHRLERQQQIGKEDRRVHFDPADRLQRDLGGQIGRSTEVEQRVALAQGAVLAHVASGLAHEPHRGGIDRLAPARFEESGIDVGQWVTLSSVRARPTRSSSHSGLNRSSAPSSRNSVEIESSRK